MRSFTRSNSCSLYISSSLAVIAFLFVISAQTCFAQSGTRTQPNSEEATQKETQQRPNIIYIMVDDLGYGDLGCFGQKEVKTPNLDKLAAQGMKLTDYYAGTTVCRPSRLVLWTGMHAGHTAISSNASYVLKPTDVTVAKLLKDSGYTTGGVGKWALGNTENTGHPNLQGFDFWYGYLNQTNAHNFYPEYLWRNKTKVTLPGNKEGKDKHVSVERVTYSHDEMTKEAFQFIQENHKKPFLLHIHWTIPHANNQGGRATGDGMEIPDHGIYKDRDWPKPEKGFAAMVSHMDQDVGRLIGLLKQLKIEENTLLIFTSDNGPHSEGGHKHQYFNSNGPLKGFKRDLYEGGIRVPTIAYWPGKINPGTTSNHQAAFYDFLPTACELAGIQPPKTTDGLSFLPTLLGKEQPSREYLFWKYGDKVAVRRGDWKAVRVGKNKPLEIYDLSTDIGENNNLASQQQKLVAVMEKIIEQETQAK